MQVRREIRRDRRKKKRGYGKSAEECLQAVCAHPSHIQTVDITLPVNLCVNNLISPVVKLLKSCGETLTNSLSAESVWRSQSNAVPFDIWPASKSS